MQTKPILAAAVSLLLASASHAAVVFSDNFDSDALGTPAVPAGFTVTGGSVDIIGTNFSGSAFDFLPGHGAYIDLDGSTGGSGLLSHSLTLTGGVTYMATFDLAGSQRGSTETGTVRFGTSALTYNVASSDGFAGRAVTFMPIVTGSYALSFQNDGGDNVGALLDNVVISNTVAAAVPEPETYALLVAGLGITAFAIRRKRNQR